MDSIMIAVNLAFLAEYKKHVNNYGAFYLEDNLNHIADFCAWSLLSILMIYNMLPIKKIYIDSRFQSRDSASSPDFKNDSPTTDYMLQDTGFM